MISIFSRFRNRFTTGVQERLEAGGTDTVLREEDLAYLPGPVRRYLHFAGAVGKPKIRNFRAECTGSLRSQKGRWMKISTCQYNFFSNPARLYYLKSSLFGIPIDSLHAYCGDHATMQINAAYLVPVVDASGEQMNTSETVTLFNDMCLFAPATLIDKNILWETVDPHSVWARFTHNGITISAMLYFGNDGGLASFVSEDRYRSEGGKTYARHQWLTPVKEYREVDGRRVPAYAEAGWRLPDGLFTYIRITVSDIEYNCRELR
jgi:hypothetical protein